MYVCQLVCWSLGSMFGWVLDYLLSLFFIGCLWPGYRRHRWRDPRGTPGYQNWFHQDANDPLPSRYPCSIVTAPVSRPQVLMRTRVHAREGASCGQKADISRSSCQSGRGFVPETLHQATRARAAFAASMSAETSPELGESEGRTPPNESRYLICASDAGFWRHRALGLMRAPAPTSLA